MSRQVLCLYHCQNISPRFQDRQRKSQYNRSRYLFHYAIFREKPAKMVKSLFSSTHQGCTQFQPYNGVYCTAIALVALLMFVKHSPKVFKIRKSGLNRNIFHGTYLYRHFMSISHVNGYLAHMDLPSDLSD